MKNNERYLTRCTDCACLVCGENGEWVCDEAGKPVTEIDTCPEGMEVEE